MMSPLPMRSFLPSRRSHVIAKAAGLALIGLSLAAGSPSVAPETRQEAVKKAREGTPPESIVILRKLLGERPDDPLTAFDLAVISTWVGRPKEAIAAFEKAGQAEAPAYALEPIIRAYRDEKRFGEAERLARAGARRFPFDPRWPTFLALLLTDEGKPDQAISLLEPWTAKAPNDPDVWLALGYAYSTKREPFETLRTYGQALRLRPGNEEAEGAMAEVLARLGAPYAAGDLLPEVPLWIQASRASLMVRWGGHVLPRDPHRRFEGTDAALRRLDELLAEARAERPIDTGLTVRLRRDRIVALRQRELWADAVAQAEELRAEGDVIPPYAREAEADSLLALRRPHEAQLGYEEVIQADPYRRESHIGLFFAFVEQENFRAAFAEIDALAKSEEPGIQRANQSGMTPNWDWLEGVTLAAEGRLFADMPAWAWNRLHPLAQAAPANYDLRRLTGDVAAARGWPRLSDEEIHIAASLAPDSKLVQVALAESALRRLRWSEARTRIAELSALYPNDVAVRRARLDLAAHDSWDYFSEFNFHYEPPSAAAEDFSPGTGYDVTTRLYTPPLAEYWRIAGAFEYHQAEVAEGLAQRYREGVGFDLRLPDLTLEGMFWYNNGSISKPGGSVAASWAPTDHWTFGAEGEIFAADTPLRAVKNGITSDLAGGSIQYDWNESQSISVDGQWHGFSDGNDRYAFNIDFARRLVDIPHFDLTLRPNLYTSHNETNDVPYFSPLNDFAANLALDAEQVIWRHYERSFGHRLVVTGGSYWQQGFGTGWTGSVLYEQVYRQDPRVELRWGIQGGRNLYDGEVVPSLDTFIQVHWLF